jgi:very-short-patch-repair endonuclease
MDESRRTGCLGLFFGWLTPSTETSESKITLPYGKKDDFLSPAELSFFRVLKSELPAAWHLITKVNLADLIFVRQPHRNQGASNRINRKHVDFVICDAGTMEPLLGIELDDASHDRQDRQERDEFVDKVFETAGLPLLHVKASRGYQTTALMAEVREAIGIKSAPPPLPSNQS